MTDAVKTWNGIATAAIKTYQGIAVANVKTINGIIAARNYATWDPANKGAGIVLSNGNLTESNGAVAPRSIWSTIAKSGSKWYWEITPASDQIMVGIATSSENLNNYPGADQYGWCYWGFNGKKINNGSQVAFGSTFASGDKIGVALDLVNGKLYFSLNGTWQNSGDPVNGTGYAYSGLSGTYFAVAGDVNGSTIACTANFGKTAFTYAAPSGYNAGLYS